MWLGIVQILADFMSCCIHFYKIDVVTACACLCVPSG